MMSLEQARPNPLTQRTEPLEYKRIFDAAPALCLLLGTDENFTILDASDAYLRATGAQRDQIIGRGLFEVFPNSPQDGAHGAANLRASLQRVLDRRAADTMAVEKHEVRCPESGGGGFEERYWSSVNSPVVSESGEIRWIVHLAEDVTELVRMNNELQREGDAIRFEMRRETEAALRESDRRRQELIATLSHELRNPLAPLRNGLNLLRVASHDEATAAVHEMMERQVSQLVRLVDDLLGRLAAMHAGSMEAHSAGEGRGAESIVRLPLAAASERSSEAQAPIACRVLVADDNRDAAESLADLLRELGADVSLAYDGEQAVELARVIQPDLALVDIGMPKLDGYQVAQCIRSEAGARALRLVALTGWGQDDDRRRARAAGFDEHLVKPAELDKLRALLESATRQKEHDGSEGAGGERPAAASPAVH